VTPALPCRRRSTRPAGWRRPQTGRTPRAGSSPTMKRWWQRGWRSEEWIKVPVWDRRWVFSCRNYNPAALMR